jgi:hypothetical protein
MEHQRRSEVRICLYGTLPPDTSGANAPITLIVDGFSGTGPTLDAGTGTVTLRPRTAGNTVLICQAGSCVGGFDVTYDLAGLAITAGTFTVGAIAHTGNITLAALTPNFNLAVTNGGTGSITVTGAYDGGALTLTSGTGGIDPERLLTGLPQRGRLHLVAPAPRNRAPGANARMSGSPSSSLRRSR